MQVIQSKIAIKINPDVFKKDPLSSDLGEKILRQGIVLIEELGFEDFTFKKLAEHISSTEASIYRYFDNKHNLLAYLIMWYWGWMDYRIMISTLNIDDPRIRLRRAIKCLTEVIQEDLTVQQIDEAKLHQIVIGESSKIYLCKSVDTNNQLGFFFAYKSIVQQVANIILEINPNYKYPHMLVSTIIEGAHHQRFFADHLPRLTDVVEGEDAVTEFYTQLTLNSLDLEA